MNEIGKYLFTTSRIQKDEPNYKDAILIENKDNIDLNDVNDLNKNKIVILSQNFKYNKLEPEWFGKSKYPLIKEYQDIINQILSENHRTFQYDNNNTWIDDINLPINDEYRDKLMNLDTILDRITCDTVNSKNRHV